MTDTSTTPVATVRIPVDKPRRAVKFLHDRGGGVMDLIAHFWDRLAQTPPLSRPDLHLVLAGKPQPGDPASLCDQDESLSGAMLYVPKAHRADVLALDPTTAEAFARYILETSATQAAPGVAAEASDAAGGGPSTQTGKPAINFLTGREDGIQAMLPLLLPMVHKRAPYRQLVNVVMQLPPEVPAEPCTQVRSARDTDLVVLNRWRKLYKEERGILFDADVEAWIESQHVFVLEQDQQVVALAKLDLVLTRLVEIGGVYTFPEFRKQGHGRRLVSDLVVRIRAQGKTPTLQVDRTNTPAVQLYSRIGWKDMGSLARAWLLSQ